MARKDFQCSTCGEFHNRLYLNDGSGEWDCGRCLLRSDPFITPQQELSVKRYLAREAQARKNFRAGAGANAV